MPQTRFHIRRKIFVLAVCVTLSAVLWLLNDLNRLQTATIQIPVKFSGLPYDMVPTNSLPRVMDATIEATGFTLLLRHFTSEKKVIDIPLRINQEGWQSGKDSNLRLLFNINAYTTEISKSLGSNVHIRKIYPDTFSIRFEKKFVKKVPVMLLSDIEYLKEFDLSGKISINPDSVIVSGIKEKVSKIVSICTQTLVLKKLNKSYEGTIDLENINGISYNVQHIDIKLPVDQFTEKTINLKITPANVPSNYELNTIPNVVSLKLLLPISSYSLISASQFQVIAPFPDSKNKTGKILLYVYEKPDFVKIININPESVEYKIKAKE